MKQTIIIDKTTPLGDLVTYYPDITSRLNQMHIDYCCQGDRTLEEAGLLDPFIEETQKAYASYLINPDRKVNVAELSDDDLIDLILEVHHIPERALWKELDPLINKILLVHYRHGKDHLMALHRAFSELKMDLEAHFAIEERELFPLMRKTDKSASDLTEIKAIIESLENDHDGAGVLIKKIIKETQDFQAPDYACPTMKAVYQKLHDLSDDIFLHIAKENSVLFKRYE